MMDGITCERPPFSVQKLPRMNPRALTFHLNVDQVCLVSGSVPCICTRVLSPEPHSGKCQAASLLPFTDKATEAQGS